MNAQDKIVSSVLLIASISVLIISTIGLVNLAEDQFAHAWLNDDIINEKGQFKNVDTGLLYSDNIVLTVEDPYQDGWD